jgi:hypothetical protein
MMSTLLDPAIRAIGDGEVQILDQEDLDAEEETPLDEESDGESDGETEEETEEETEDDDDETAIVKEVKRNFFDRDRKPKRLVCPFSDLSRTNPCETHAEPKSRKDVVERHLVKVKSAGGDEQHPINDPLWQSFQVVWFLTPRPEFTERKRKRAKGSAQSRYYLKCKDKQENEEAEAKRKLEEGLIGEDEYKKVLIGGKRREFIAERATERRVRTEMQKEMEDATRDMENRLQDERKLRDDIEAKLHELRAQATAPNTAATSAATSTTASTTTSTAIADLESARQELEASHVAVESYKTVLSAQAANVVNFRADDGFFTATGMTYMQHYGFEWPTEVSQASFYTFVTLLRATADWEGDIRSNSSLRHMQRELHEWVSLETQNVEGSPDYIAALNDIIGAMQGRNRGTFQWRLGQQD